MSFALHFRSGFGTASMLVSVALLSLLVARSAPPRFPRAQGAHSTINSDSHHDQRPRFDNANHDWSMPADNLLASPPAAESAKLNVPPALFSTLQAKGLHFNRPPPVH